MNAEQVQVVKPTPAFTIAIILITSVLLKLGFMWYLDGRALTVTSKKP